MKNSIKIGNLYVRKIVGKEWKEGGPSILLCHGFGAQGDDLVGLHQIVKEPSKFQWFFPEGIVEIDFGFGMKGRAWWPINFAEWNQFLEDGKPEMLQERLPDSF